MDTLHSWFDHYLLGYDNGIEREPMADIERTPTTGPRDSVWPPHGTRTATLRPTAGARPGVGALGLRTGTGTATFTDDPRLDETNWAARIDTPTPEKAGFVTGAAHPDLRLSGSSQVTVTATPTTATAHLSAVLVDLGPDTIRDYAAGGEGITTLDERTCWGESTAGDSACFKETKAKTVDVGATVFSRGWADLGPYADPGKGVPLTPGKAYTITLDLAATDHVVPAGHRLALIVAGTDRDLIDPPADTPTLAVDLSRTSARVPFVGGAKAFAAATAGSRPAAAAPHAAPPAGTGAPRRELRLP